MSPFTFTKYGVEFKSLAVIGFPRYMIGSDQVCWGFCRGSWRVLKKTVCPKGYLYISVSNTERRTRIAVHRLMLFAFVGPCPKDMECRHLDGVKTDNRLENLVWGTRKENSDDKRKHDAIPIGIRSGKAKLNDNVIREIRTIANKGEVSLRAIGRKYNVNVVTIIQITQRRTWKHVL